MRLQPMVISRKRRHTRACIIVLLVALSRLVGLSHSGLNGATVWMATLKNRATDNFLDALYKVPMRSLKPDSQHDKQVAYLFETACFKVNNLAGRGGTRVPALL